MIKLLDILRENKQVTDEDLKSNIAATAIAASFFFNPHNAKIPAKVNTEQPAETSFSKNFKKAVNDVIDNIEGGYYTPGQVDDERYARSGETMFGIDRLRGGDINKTSAANEFWSLIDKSKEENPEEWKWNYKGGKLKPQLKQLTSEMIKPQFENFFNRYLSKEAQDVVNSDYRLFFNFVYATWNGQGWFRKFANKLNYEVKKGNYDTTNLFNKMINAREQSGNSLIAQHADTIKGIVDESFC
jgi:hypothetical protein